MGFSLSVAGPRHPQPPPLIHLVCRGARLPTAMLLRHCPSPKHGQQPLWAGTAAAGRAHQGTAHQGTAQPCEPVGTGGLGKPRQHLPPLPTLPALILLLSLFPHHLCSPCSPHHLHSPHFPSPHDPAFTPLPSPDPLCLPCSHPHSSHGLISAPVSPAPSSLPWGTASPLPALLSSLLPASFSLLCPKPAAHASLLPCNPPEQPRPARRSSSHISNALPGHLMCPGQPRHHRSSR